MGLVCDFGVERAHSLKSESLELKWLSRVFNLKEKILDTTEL